MLTHYPTTQSCVRERAAAVVAPLRSSSVSKRGLHVSRATGPRSSRLHFRMRDAELPSSGRASPAAAAEDSREGTQPAAAAAPSTRRPRVVLLGSGWAAMSLIKALPANICERYELVLVSPRNYFLYTPLLPAVAAGSVEERSIVEPVRKLLAGKGTYYEACVQAVDPAAKRVTACFPRADPEGGEEELCGDSFSLGYDLLIVGVGSVNTTCGVPGVGEHCCFLKTVEDAHALRRRVSDCFERAALPHATDADRARLLSFVVCGGGPTGVEVAAELHDMVHADLAPLFPRLMPHVRIALAEMQDQVLASYAPAAGRYTAGELRRQGLELLLSSRVLRVADGCVTVAGKDGAEQAIPFGACVWATGIGAHPLVQELCAAFPDSQTHGRHILTDEFLRVQGSDGSIWALGDAARTIQNQRALPATAQVAAQEGQFVAQLLQKNAFDEQLGTLRLREKQKPFSYFHKGALAYVGEDRAVMDESHLNDRLVLTGVQAGLVWRSYEAIAQISPRTTLMVLQNWVRTRVFGRDLSNM